MNKIRNLWEERSKKYKDDVKGVLPKSFPRWLNSMLDAWMFAQVKEAVKKGDMVLDLGCGYGRVSKEILRNIKETRVRGVDISQNYVDIYNQKLSSRGRAERGDIKKLAHKSGYFDSVVMITTLMYLTSHRDQMRAIGEIMRVLKPGGKFVFIERNPYGHGIMTFGGLITQLRGKKNKEIKSVSFKKSQIRNLVESWGGKIERYSGFPFGFLTLPSLYISYVGVKK